MLKVVLYTSSPLLAIGAQIAFEKYFEVAICDSIESLRRAGKRDITILDFTSSCNLEVMRTTVRAGMTALWVCEIEIEIAMQALHAGIRGILRKTASAESLTEDIQSILEGKLVLEQSLSDALLTASQNKLTRRESQLVTLLSQGLKNREIATTLRISENTVKVYLSHLFHKVGVKDRFELALYGYKNLAHTSGELGQMRSIVMGKKLPQVPPQTISELLQ
jgi:DNA-binding NarL/FixJ family response regulator